MTATIKTTTNIDFASVDNLLPEEALMVRYMVKNFSEKEIIPRISECFEKGRFPRGLVYKMADLGLLGIKTNSVYDGAEGNNMMYGVACYAIEQASSGLRSFLSVTNSLVMFPIEKFGSEDQRQKWLPGIAGGKVIGCFGLTDPDSGSNPAEMKCFAVKKGSKYIINGSKQWITNATIADIAIVWAKTDKNDTTGKSIRGFIVKRENLKGQKNFGFVSSEEKGKWSMRASDTGSLFFDNVEVDEKDMLPGTKDGLKTALMCLNEARHGIAWGAIGMASWCLDKTNEYLQARMQRGRRLAGKQRPQAKMAQMAEKITQGQLMAWRVATLLDENAEKEMNKEEFDKLVHFIFMAKSANCEAALYVTRECRNLMGANGISLEYHIFRHMCNAETLCTYEGTRDTFLLSVGRKLTGLSSF